jgi:hypothetical protein
MKLAKVLLPGAPQVFTKDIHLALRPSMGEIQRNDTHNNLEVLAIAETNDLSQQTGYFSALYPRN